MVALSDVGRNCSITLVRSSLWCIWCTGNCQSYSIGRESENRLPAQTSRHFTMPKKGLHCSIIAQGCPGFIRIKTLQLLKFCERCRSKILLVYDPVMTNDEAIHARHAVF